MISFRKMEYDGLSIWSHSVSASDISDLRDLIEYAADSKFIVSGEINLDEQSVTFNQSYSDIAMAKFDGKEITASFLVTSGDSSAMYNFDLLFSTGENIAFNWYSSAAKIGMQVMITEEEQTSLTVTDLNEELDEIKKICK